MGEDQASHSKLIGTVSSKATAPMEVSIVLLSIASGHEILEECGTNWLGEIDLTTAAK